MLWRNSTTALLFQKYGRMHVIEHLSCDCVRKVHIIFSWRCTHGRHHRTAAWFKTLPLVLHSSSFNSNAPSIESGFAVESQFIADLKEKENLISILRVWIPYESSILVFRSILDWVWKFRHSNAIDTHEKRFWCSWCDSKVIPMCLKRAHRAHNTYFFWTPMDRHHFRIK